MYEVKVTLRFDNIVRQVTLATFERDSQVPDFTLARAKEFAKQIDEAYAVDIIRVADEDNRDKAFGLVYHRDAEVA